MIDAHCHFHQVAFDGRRDEAWAAARAAGVTAMVVNGTAPADWDAVASLAESDRNAFLPAYGVHPWQVAGLPADWLGQLRERLVADAAAGVGEVGLDRWVEGHDVALQGEILAAQWRLARELDRPVTVHVLRAWDDWLAFLRAHPEPVRPFLLHAYGGPATAVPELVVRGAFFSFSTAFIGPHHRSHGAFRAIPADRLLVETDAPSMPPPPDLDQYGWRGTAGERVNHPANLRLALSRLAELRGLPERELAEQVQANFQRWWMEGMA